MLPLTVLVLSVALGSSAAPDLDFPPWFKFGASTAAYQVEGAWNVSGKVPNIWDQFTHSDPSHIRDRSNGDVACDSYRLWRRDVEVAAELGLQYYRFSVSWSRLIPNPVYPKENEVNSAAVQYYINLIDALLEKGIEPILVMHHFDLPQSLQDLGGWTNPDIINYFGEYARVIYKLFGSRVKIFSTVNEPEVLCDIAYQTGTFAPGILEPKLAPFLCTKNVLMAHATAYRIYDADFRKKYNGIITIDNNVVWIRPASDKQEDVELAELARDLTCGMHLYPIYSKEGGWPPKIEKKFEEYRKNEGYVWSRFPGFSQEDKDFVRGTVDRMHMHYYQTLTIRQAKPGERASEFFFRGIPELNAVLEENKDIAHDYNEELTSWPKGLRELLAYLKRTYGDQTIMVTENGIGPESRSLKDDIKMSYIREHLEQILLSIKEDAVNVIGYIYWSSIDNFEWADGYTKKFGLYDVDFNSKDRTRTPRSSALYYKCIIENKSIDEKKCSRKQFLNAISSSFNSYYSSSSSYASAYASSFSKRGRSMKYVY